MTAPATFRFRQAARLLVLSFLGLSVACAHAQDEACGPLSNSFGPYDYRADKGYNLQVVEKYHFTPQVEALLRGESGRIGGDLDYTLRAFPNHHRALVSVMRYGEKLNTGHPGDLPRSVECYFVRALRFRPDDSTARMLYARYLDSAARHEEAVQQLDKVSADAPAVAFTQYNLGMVHLEAKRYDLALKHAHAAMALGFPRPELKAGLQAAGRWREPTPAAADLAASGPAAR